MKNMRKRKRNGRGLTFKKFRNYKVGLS